MHECFAYRCRVQIRFSFWSSAEVNKRQQQIRPIFVAFNFTVTNLLHVPTLKVSTEYFMFATCILLHFLK